MIGYDKPDVTVFLVQSVLEAFLRQETGVTNIYRNPNQQDNKLPCWHINFLPSSLSPSAVNNRYYRNLGLDLVYMQDFNEPQLYNDYLSMAETLDEKLELLGFAYTYQATEDSEPETHYAYLRAVNADWNVALDAMHYRFEINLRVSKSFDQPVKMMVIEELNEYVKEVLSDGTEIWQKW